MTPEAVSADRDPRADIIATCTQMAWLADQRDWEGLLDVFCESVLLDYTSLNGGAPAQLARGDIVDAWRTALGSLDATQHLVANHLVDVDGTTAICTATFQATHVFGNDSGDPHWVLGGDYHFELRRDPDRWRIAAVTMTAKWATGNQQIMALAAERSSEPVPHAAAAPLRFLDALARMDIDRAVACFTADAVQEMPYSPPGFPSVLDGADAIHRQYGGLPDAYESMSFDVQRTTQSGDRVVLEYVGTIRLRAGGTYDNRYVGVFELRDGLIARYREYFNPLVLAGSFDSDAMADTFSVEGGAAEDEGTRWRWPT